MEKTIIRGATISLAQTTTKETDEQRRIAALEERISMLESALTGAQTQVVLNTDRFSVVGSGAANFSEN